MAGLPWIKVWTVIGDHPKIQRLEKSLGVADALGVVVRMWCWVAEYHPDGEVPKEHVGTLARVARGRLRCSPERVEAALSECGFLDTCVSPDTLVRVHDWADMQVAHLDAIERKRAQSRERQARHRAKRNADGVTVTRDVTRDSVTERERESERESYVGGSSTKIRSISSSLVPETILSASPKGGNNALE